VNSSWLGDKIRINHHVNIGVAVAVEDGLLVPVVRFADTKTLSQISRRSEGFCHNGQKNKKLQPADWEGKHVHHFQPGHVRRWMSSQRSLIPAGCLYPGSKRYSKYPRRKNGAVVPGNVMKLTLSCDHRVVDGATGSAFLQTLERIAGRAVEDADLK